MNELYASFPFFALRMRIIEGLQQARSFAGIIFSGETLQAADERLGKLEDARQKLVDKMKLCSIPCLRDAVQGALKLGLDDDVLNQATAKLTLLESCQESLHECAKGGKIFELEAALMSARISGLLGTVCCFAQDRLGDLRACAGRLNMGIPFSPQQLRPWRSVSVLCITMQATDQDFAI